MEKDQRDQQVEGHQVNIGEMHGDIDHIGDRIDTGGGDYTGGDYTGGDRLTLGNVAARAAVAVGRGARAEVSIFNVDLRLLPLVLFLLIAVGSLSFLLLRADTPDQMRGEFNVAVAEFMVVDDEGERIRSNEGRELGEWMYGRLLTSFRDLEVRGYELWPPGYTRTVRGNTRDAREAAADVLAQDINADIVVYGVITKSPDNPRVNLEFFVNYKGFQEGEEVTGQHCLGRTLPFPQPFDKEQFQGVDNPALTARVEGLGLLTIGLSYYATDDFDQAIRFFKGAADSMGSSRGTGQDVVQLLLGNANVRQASKLNSLEPLSDAENHYAEALVINPDYARAQVGLANVLHLRAMGDPQNPAFDDVDPALLDQAEHALQEAREMPDAPETANIEPKIHFCQGQIDLVRSQLEGTEWLSRAREEFEAVLVAYGGKEASLENFAGQAHARIASIELLEGNVEAALQRYREAANLSSPFYQARYQARRGDILAAMCKTELALDAYDEAIRTAEFFGYEASVEEYIERRARVSGDEECP